MNDDLITEAISCLRGKGWDNEADSVAELIAEIERLQEIDRNHNKRECELISDLNELKNQLTIDRQTIDAYRDQNVRYAEQLATKHTDHAHKISRIRNIFKWHRACMRAMERRVEKMEQLAIQERAQIIQYHRGILYPLERDPFLWSKISEDEKQICYELAANELAIQPSQQANYLEKLEAAFLQSDISAQYHGSKRIGINYTDEQMQQKAQAALDKLRAGN